MEQNRDAFQIANIYKWQENNLGEGAHIVVLDQGVNLFKYYTNVTTLTFDSELTSSKDKTNHGNAILAVGYQIAPNARVTYIPINDLKGDGEAKALKWIEDNADDIDVITMSLNYAERHIKGKYDGIAKTKIPFFNCTGNESDDKVKAPAKFDYCIGVGSAYYVYGKVSTARDMNYGEGIDVIGFSNIYYPNDNGKAVGQIGTSISTPFVAYATLLYISWRKKNKLPKLTIDGWREWQKKCVLDMNTPGYDLETGLGLFRLPSEIPTLEKENDKMSFNDTKNHWAEGAIDFVSDKGLLKGYEDGTFKPERAVTRAELAMVLARQNGYVEKK